MSESDREWERPHIVYAKGLREGEVLLFQNWQDAFRYCQKNSTYKAPLMIRSTWREIDPAEHVGDPNE